MSFFLQITIDTDPHQYELSVDNSIGLKKAVERSVAISIKCKAIFWNGMEKYKEKS